MSITPPLPCPACCSALIVAVCLLWIVPLSAQTKRPAADTVLNSKSQQPIPRDGVPDELRRLIEDGRVVVVYESEPEFVNAARGWADFNLQLRYSFKYEVTKTRKGGRWQVKLSITQLDVTIELTHLIRLPTTFQSPKVWHGRTLRHEFDHVAVSLDPRARSLLKHLLDHLPDIERTLEPKESPTPELLNKLLDDEIVKRRKAVVELMRQNNIRLDKLSVHGSQPIAERAAFFTRLYTKENLAEMQFPYIEQVLDLLKTPEFQKAESPYLARDPAAG